MEDYETYTIISQKGVAWKRHFSAEWKNVCTRLIGSKKAIVSKKVKKNNNVNLSRAKKFKQ